MALGLLDQTCTSALRLANLEVLINAVLYNPSLALHLMETSRPGAARTFFDRWFAAINAELPRVHDKKLSVLALCALLEIPSERVPEALKAGWPGIVGGVLSIFRELPKAVEKRKELMDALAEEEEEEDDEDHKFLNLNDEEGEFFFGVGLFLGLNWFFKKRMFGMKTLRTLSCLRMRCGLTFLLLLNCPLICHVQGARLREKSENKEAAVGGDEEDDVSEDEDIEEELGYISPLETVDPYLSFKQALTSCVPSDRFFILDI